MKTTNQICKQTGVTVRTLHHYDAIGLLKPSKITEAGYRLYLIILYRELDFSLKEIASILDAPDFDRNQALEQQIRLLEQKRERLQNRIYLARVLRLTGVKFLDYTNFDYKKLDDYQQEATLIWSKTDTCKEYKAKSKHRSKEYTKALSDDMMALVTKVGTLRDHGPDSGIVQNWVAELQAFITEHYYTCTKPMLKVLGELYAGGGSMTENIDKVGGHGTGEFAKAAIDIFCEN